MFLAWNEIKHSKARYFLIIGVVILVSYLVYFLTGLAYGLAQENRIAVDQWEADGIVLTDESNSNINMSMLSTDQVEEVKSNESTALGVTQNVIRKEGETGEDSKVNVTFFGIDQEDFLMPEITEGTEFQNSDEVVADISLNEVEGIEIGDTLKLAGTDKEVTVVGFTEDTKYSVTPVLHTDVDTYMEVRYSQTEVPPETVYSALVYRGSGPGQDVLADNDLVAYEIDDFILELPGYSAQLLTFGLMIGFLVLIAAIVIGIFIYVLTLQKKSLFGVMKAQGISNGYISNSVVIQTLLLTVAGVGIGLALTIATSFVLPPAVPYSNNFLFFAIITALLLVMAVLGGLFSVKTVVSIDPLDAIG
ncbi:ABC transporter permease [Atopococcus tabaci]|uniref:ABC transporter permease n=1 Tax=Atopococcus tabaci TaxID=269774 RepID=UPI0024098D02|nr:ABC transporter permease [Atopococcus tabaci]